MFARQRFSMVRVLVVCNLILMAIVAAQFFRGHDSGRDEVPLSDKAASLLAPAVEAQSAAYAAFPSLAEAAKRVSPSIISIGAVHTVTRRAWMRDYFSPFYTPYDLERQERIPYLGSGVVISADGMVLTNYHVIEGAKDLFVTTQEGAEVNAKLIDADKVLDVAVIKLDSKNCVPATIGDSSKLQAGDWVLAVGNPFGNMIGDPHPTITHGVVSALNRSFAPSEGRAKVYPNMIQTDAAINPGNSGGALVDAYGRVVGICTFIFTSSGGSEGIGFAIPINRAMRVVQEIQRYGHIRNLYAGFDVTGISDSLASRLRLKSSQGAYVVTVDRDGPAAQAGLRAGDIILAIDNQSCENEEKCWVLLAAHYVGDTVSLTILRDAKTYTVAFALKEGK